MSRTITPYMSIRDSRIPLVGLASLCLTAIFMLIFSATPLQSNPWWGLLLGGCLSALLLSLILSATGLWSRQRAIEEGTYCASCGEESRQEDESVETAVSLANDDLERLGLRPTYEGDMINVSYQGGYFHIVPLSEHMLRLIYPCIYVTEIDKQDLLTRILNRVNEATPIIKLTAGALTFEGKLSVNAVIDMMYLPEDGNRAETLCNMMEYFFEAQRSLALGMAAADLQEPEPEVSAEIMDTLKHLSLN